MGNCGDFIITPPWIILNKIHRLLRFQGFSSKLVKIEMPVIFSLFWARPFNFWVLVPLIYALRLIKTFLAISPVLVVFLAAGTLDPPGLPYISKSPGRIGLIVFARGGGTD